MSTSALSSSAQAGPLRLGILGCAHIARAFARDVSPGPHASLVAVASREQAKASAFAADFGIPRHHGSYEALLADGDVEAVYIPLPNSLHAQWAVRAAQAGKHVLCEKPLALNLAQARAMFEAAQRHGVMLLEAYPWWFQPQTGVLVELLHGATAPSDVKGAGATLGATLGAGAATGAGLTAGAIGTVQSVQASFGFTLSRPAGNIRLDPSLGGGALLDAGCYPLSLIRLAMGQAPERVTAHPTWGPSGVDLAMMATLHYGDGRHAQLACSMVGGQHRYALINGSDGVIETEYLNHSHTASQPPVHGFLPSRMRLRRGVAAGAPFEEIVCPGGSGFAFAAEAFARVVRLGDHAAIAQAARVSLDIAATLEALAASARSGRTVKVPRT